MCDIAVLGLDTSVFQRHAGAQKKRADAYTPLLSKLLKSARDQTDRATFDGGRGGHVAVGFISSYIFFHQRNKNWGRGTHGAKVFHQLLKRHLLGA